MCNSGEDPGCAAEDFGKSDYVEECPVEDTVCMKQVTQQYTRQDGKPEEGT